MKNSTLNQKNEGNYLALALAGFGASACMAIFNDNDGSKESKQNEEVGDLFALTGLLCLGLWYKSV